MSINALHHITGDTPQSGYRQIGASDAFPTDQLLWLNNNNRITVRSRIEISSGRPKGNAGIQSHIWEYQSGKYGTPVVINSFAAIGGERSHAFSEYVCGVTDNAAALADAGSLIRGAEKIPLLDVDTFMRIPGKNVLSCGEDSWEPDPQAGEGRPVSAEEEKWLLPLLGRYWKEASVRAFSEDSPETVHVNLGRFSEDILEDTEETIRQARDFFSDVICPNLPRQVQNIASMAAGVNCADKVTLFTALEFDISQNMYAGDTITGSDPLPARYRLTQAETDFMRMIVRHETPACIAEFFRRYKEAAEKEEATELNTPFMADYRVWYAVYCADRIIREKHEFILQAGLTHEHGNPKPVRDARACLLLINRLRRLLEEDHQLSQRQGNLITNWLAPLETGLMEVMLEDLRSGQEQPFMIFRNEKSGFFRKYLYTALDSQLDLMINLTVQDQLISGKPQFIICHPEVPIQENADGRSAAMMKALLEQVVRPIIDAEDKQESTKNKYLEYMRSETFADGWALQEHSRKTRAALADFFEEEIQDSKKHFMLYKISLKYIEERKLLLTTLQHFKNEHTAPGKLPGDFRMKVAIHSAKNYIDEKECNAALNEYYRCCFREYRGGIGQIGEVVEALGGNTTEAMALIFQDAEQDIRMKPDEAAAVFHTFGGGDGQNGNYATREQTRKAYVAMLTAWRERILGNPGPEANTVREDLVDWLTRMAAAAPFDIDPSGDIQAIFESASEGQRLSKTPAEKIFQNLMGRASDQEGISRAYNAMMNAQLDRALKEQDSSVIDWISDMISTAGDGIRIDTTESLRKIIENAQTGERMKPSDARKAFTVMGPKALDKDTAVLPVFREMLSIRRREAEKNADPEAFTWLCEMLDYCPWRDRREWIEEQRTENTILACENSMKTGKPADAGTLSMIQKWVEAKTIQSRGMNRLQRYCNYWLEKGSTESAERFQPYMDTIDEENRALQDYIFRRARFRVENGLKRSAVSFGDLINSCSDDVERSGKRMDDLYAAAREPVDEYLVNHFETTTELNVLIREMEQLPENSAFLRKWQELLGKRISTQQVELFNRQSDLEKLEALRRDILQKTPDLNDTLRSAYRLTDAYPGMLAGLSEKTEYEAVSGIRSELGEVNTMLRQAQEVRKTLCASLRKHGFPEYDQLRNRSFRHGLCGAMLRASLTDSSASPDGCPDWNIVLHMLFQRGEVEAAVKAPYKPENLPVLQKLLALVESVRQMEKPEGRREWTEALVKVIHSDSLFHRYQNALGRNRKMKEAYGLDISESGIEF